MNHNPNPIINQFNQWLYCGTCGFKCWMDEPKTAPSNQDLAEVSV